MLKKDEFFKDYFINSTQFKKNLKKTKIAFNSFLKKLKNNQIPLLDSYKKSFEFDFSKSNFDTFSRLLGDRRFFRYVRFDFPLETPFFLRFRDLRYLKGEWFGENRLLRIDL